MQPWSILTKSNKGDEVEEKIRWALVRDDDDGELRVLKEHYALESYLNADPRSNNVTGNWELMATDTDRDALLAMARLSEQVERKVTDEIWGFKNFGRT